jgi:hypothetical protein
MQKMTKRQHACVLNHGNTPFNAGAAAVLAVAEAPEMW